MAKIRQMVARAAGFNADRGDTSEQNMEQAAGIMRSWLKGEKLTEEAA